MSTNPESESRPLTYSEVVNMSTDDGSDPAFPGQFEKDQVGPEYAAPEEAPTVDGCPPVEGSAESAGEEAKPGGAPETGIDIEEVPHEGEQETQAETKTVAEGQEEPSNTELPSNMELQPPLMASDTSDGLHGPASDTPKSPEGEVKEEGDSTQASPETTELQSVSLEEGEFGYHPGRDSEPGEETGENPEAARTRRRLSHSEPPCHSAPKPPVVVEEATAETAELRKIFLKKGEFGYNPGKEGDPGEDTGENPKASRTRRRLSHDEPPHHSAPKPPARVSKSDPAVLTVETVELRRMSLKKGEFGYNPGKEGDPGEATGENPKASLTRRRLSHSGPPQHSAPKQPAPIIQTSKTWSAEGTIETAELRRVSLKQSEFGYHPGTESEPGEDTGENPEAARTRRRFSHSEPPHHSIMKQSAPIDCDIGNEPSSGHVKRKHSDTSAEADERHEDTGMQRLKGTIKSRESRHVGLGKGGIGNSSGKGDGHYRQEPGEHLQAKHVFRRAKTDPGTEELSHIGVGSGDFGYNVGRGSDPGGEAGENPEASQARRRFDSDPPRHSAKSTQTAETQELGHIRADKRDTGPQRAQTSPETRELRQISLRRGEFGYNVGRGEESGRIRPDGAGSENPNAGRARRRASVHSDGDCKQEKERPDFGFRNAPRHRRSSQELAINQQSHATPSLQANAPRSEHDTGVNDTLKTYLQDFLADRASGKVSEYPKAHTEGVHDPSPSESPEEHHRKPSSSTEESPVTFAQLQQALGQFKRDILVSLNPRPALDPADGQKQRSGAVSQLVPRLRRVEADIDFIRTQINIIDNDDDTTQERPGSSPTGDIAARPTMANTYRREKSEINWVVVSLAIVAAVSLIAFGEMLGSARHTGKGLGDRLAEWLFMEGRGQKVSGK